MPTENGKIKSPVSIADISTCISSNSLDLGTLCRSSLVNPWAKYKPVIAPGHWVDRDTSPVPAFFGLGNMNGGDTPPNTMKPQELINFYSDTAILKSKPANGWRYLQPTDGSSARYRMYDFLRIGSGGAIVNPGQYAENGYDNNARNPFRTFDLTSEQVLRTSGVVGGENSEQMPEHEGLSNAWLCITDYNNAQGTKMLYYGILITPLDNNEEWTSGNAYIILSQRRVDYVYDETIGFLRGHETLRVQYLIPNGGINLSNGKYRVYPFLTSTAPESVSWIASGNYDFYQSKSLEVQYAQRNSNLTITMFPLPGSAPKIMNVYESPVEVAIEATRGPFNIAIGFKIRNNRGDGKAITVKYCEMFLRNSDTPVPDGLVPGSDRQTNEVFYCKTAPSDTSLLRFDNTYPQGTTIGVTHNSELNGSPVKDKQISAGNELAPFTISGELTNPLYESIPAQGVNYLNIRCVYQVYGQAAYNYSTACVRIPSQPGPQPVDPNLNV